MLRIVLDVQYSHIHTFLGERQGMITNIIPSFLILPYNGITAEGKM